MNRRQILRGAAATFAVTGLAGRTMLRAQAPSPVGETRTGRIRGFVDRGINVFKGIPYGADTAPRRFMPPLPAAAWAGIRDATNFGPRAPQPGSGQTRRTGFASPPDLGEVSEDCLCLNVWSPALRDGGKRPVMVYFHGGAYNTGSVTNTLYDGVNLCRRGDVVVVTVNHRLNLFGYLYLAELDAELADSGNAGMLDLVLALEWVRDTIENFGGDPSRVLIFGQSGGGAKCATLMGMPAARGLFHRVITMSGQQITASRPQSAAARTRTVLAAMQVNPARAAELRAMPMQKLIEASRAVSYYGPVKDGRTLVRDPFDPDAPPISADVPMILGNTHDETRYLIGGGDATTFELTWDTLPAKLAQNGQFLGTLNQDYVIRQYREMYPAYSASDVFFAATTASRSWRGQLIEAERRAAQPIAKEHTWVYELDWQSPVDGGKWGAPHTLDIPLAFGNVEVADQMTGDGPEARSLAALMSGTFIEFARKGEPNHPGLPHWSPYGLDKRETMSFQAQSKLVNDPRGRERRLVEQVPYTQPGT
jgi:para-nitrobenzyl esterase